jgi:tRNA (guanine-N7-)-methyltransferase
MASLNSPDADGRTDGHRRYLRKRQARIAAIRKFLAESFEANTTVTLEIGCGHGHYLTAYAGQHPGKTCLGIDIVSKRIRKANEKKDKRGLENLWFLKAEVTEILEAWPETLRIERIFILFPDPWPKKRHAKNRILQTALLDSLSRVASPGTLLHFRTDDPANFEWGRSVITDHARWTIRTDLEWPFENPSYFQDLLGIHESLTACLHE